MVAFHPVIIIRLFTNNWSSNPLVPGSPSAVKALLMTPDSILVSWKAPELPNGIVNQYTVYIQEGSVNTAHYCETLIESANNKTGILSV